MPELPEVECVRRGLEARLTGARIASVRVQRRRVIVGPGDPIGGWSRSGSTRRPTKLDDAMLLVGARLERVLRHGKQLALAGDDGRIVGAHLGMTGQLRVLAPGETDAALGHVHVWWIFENGASLIFRDPRRFGGLWIHEDERAMRAQRWNALGPDALEISPGELERALAGARVSLKAALLDQRRLAGVGNIYADEAAFEARLDPRRLAGSLRRAEVRRLTTAIRRVLKRAIERGGSSMRDYVGVAGEIGSATSGHRVYGRGGQPCVRCGGELRRAMLAQRTTVWCSTCQG